MSHFCEQYHQVSWGEPGSANSEIERFWKSVLSNMVRRLDLFLFNQPKTNTATPSVTLMPSEHRDYRAEQFDQEGWMIQDDIKLDSWL